MAKNKHYATLSMNMRKRIFVTVILVAICISAATEEVEQAGEIDPVEATGVYTPPPELIAGVEISDELQARQLVSQKLHDLLELARRWRPVYIDTKAFYDMPDALVEHISVTDPPLGNTISVVLFPGEIVELHNSSIHEWNNESFSWIGESADGSIHASFTVSGKNDVAAHIHDTANNQKYSISKARGTPFHIVVEIDPAALENKEF